MSYHDEYINDESPAWEQDHNLVHKKTRYDPTNNYKITTPIVHAFIAKSQPNPGGANIFALSSYGTPPFNPIGNAIRILRMPSPCEPAIQVINQSDVNTMLGGIIAGQLYSQPLFDNATGTFGGLDIEENS